MPSLAAVAQGLLAISVGARSRLNALEAKAGNQGERAMNIRDHHSKFGLGSATRLDRDEFAARANRHTAHEPDGATTKSESLVSFKDTLHALGEADPSKFAGVLTAIADELRAAADSSRGPQSGILGELADQFDNVAHADDTGEPAAPVGQTVAASAASAVDQSSGPTGQPALQQVSPSATSTPPLVHDTRASEALLSKILDAVSSALARVATNSAEGTVIAESVDGVTTTITSGGPKQAADATSSTAA